MIFEAHRSATIHTDISVLEVYFTCNKNEITIRVKVPTTNNMHNATYDTNTYTRK